MYNEEINLISPKKFSGLVAWYDASRITGLNNNDTVSQWDDLSGNGYHLAQNDNSKKPVYNTNVKNGLSAVYFNGASNTMSTEFGTTFNQPNTIIAVFNYEDAEDRQIYDSNNSSNRNMLMYRTDAVGFFSQYLTYFGGMQYVGTGNVSFVISNMVSNETNSSLSINNGFPCYSPGNPGSYGISGITAGSRYGGTARFWKGYLCEMIVFNKDLSSFEKYSINNYLTKKWALTNKTFIAKDSMTRADNPISMGNCESNQYWNVGSYDNTELPTVGISSNYGYFPSTSGTDSHAWIETGFSDCTISCKINYDSDADKGILFRRVDANNYFYAHIDTTNNNLVISRCLNGVRSDIASVSGAAVSAGDSKYWSVVLSGSAILVTTTRSYKVLTTTDTNLVTATKHGIYNASGNTSSFSNFIVEV